MYASYSGKLRLSRGRTAIVKFPGVGCVDFQFLKSDIIEAADTKTKTDTNPAIIHVFFEIISFVFPNDLSFFLTSCQFLIYK